MSVANSDSGAPLPVPLCRAYASVVFLDVYVQQAEIGRPEPTHRWGVGVLSDGQQECLGVWEARGQEANAWIGIASDLKARGVEKIRLAIGPDLPGLVSVMRLAYPDAAVLPVRLNSGRRTGVGARPSAFDERHLPTFNELVRIGRMGQSMARLNQTLFRVAQGSARVTSAQGLAYCVSRALGSETPRARRISPHLSMATL